MLETAILIRMELLGSHLTPALSTKIIKQERVAVTVEAQEQSPEIDRCPSLSSQDGIFVKLVQSGQG
jgi:hypothetical protein